MRANEATHLGDWFSALHAASDTSTTAKIVSPMMTVYYTERFFTGKNIQGHKQACIASHYIIPCIKSHHITSHHDTETQDNTAHYGTLSTLQCTTGHYCMYTTVHYNTLHYTTAQCSAMQHNVLHHITRPCIELHCDMFNKITYHTLHCVA